MILVAYRDRLESIRSTHDNFTCGQNEFCVVILLLRSLWRAYNLHPMSLQCRLNVASVSEVPREYPACRVVTDVVGNPSTLGSVKARHQSWFTTRQLFSAEDFNQTAFWLKSGPSINHTNTAYWAKLHVVPETGTWGLPLRVALSKSHTTVWTD